jgi:hypothetical protein
MTVAAAGIRRPLLFGWDLIDILHQFDEPMSLNNA